MHVELRGGRGEGQLAVSAYLSSPSSQPLLLSTQANVLLNHLAHLEFYLIHPRTANPKEADDPTLALIR